MLRHDSEHVQSVETRLYLEAANSSEHTPVLIGVFGETQEIEFVQFNDGQSHAALQT